MRYPLLIIVLLAHLSRAQTFDKIKLDSLLSRVEHANRGMGSLALAVDGNQVYARAIGFADVESDVKSTPETRYRIGSITKTFTAAIIMQLVDEKKLTLQTKLGEYFPSVPNAGIITIEQLLRHRSGIYNVTDAVDYTTWHTTPQSPANMLSRIEKSQSLFEPGSKFQYSNSNYILLGWIAERLDGRPFAQILEQRITRPLGLRSTYVFGEIAPSKREAYSYRKANPWVKEAETHTTIPGGAGNIVSTSSDVNKFYHALLQGKVVSAESISLMKTIEGRVGMGLFQFPFNEKKAYGHTGGIDGFFSMTAYFPDSKLAVTYLSNGVNMPINDLMIGVLSIYFGEPYTLPTFQPPLLLTLAELKPLEGIYSSSTFPLKITITSDQNVLRAQATGQPSFALDAVNKTTFTFDAAKIRMEFEPQKGVMVFSQFGKTYQLNRE